MNKYFTNNKLRMLYLSSVFLFLQPIKEAYSQKVFEVEYKYQADISVQVVDASYKADLLVFKAKSALEVDGNNGVWFFTKEAYTASKKLYFVSNEYQSDLRIYYVKERYKAGWKNPEKRYLLD